MIESKLFRLNFKDLTRGLVMAVIAALVTYFSNPTLDLAMIDWAYIGKVALTTAIAYLGKNLITDESGTIHIGVAKI